ncbi:uncharacterized protein LOC127750085 [Frankliniella occidentalis]|uniref:Uncharacterized protein LOC127750085 n=1 Tax=Frankliniella occidentalis TaxID=133901 RepID=A0A9C6U342_FRAOC|nr:uncharacterized protein LOC127750085 [Frankliniella occidentalis]
MDHQKYSSASSDPECQNSLTPETVQNISDFVGAALQKKQIRGDYEYFLELVLIFIGECPPKGVRFRPPIALTSARFMGRIIYCLSIYVFARSGQFTVESALLENIRDVCIFIVTTYIKPWFTATVPAAGPRTDLQLIKDIQAYKHSNAIAKTALKAYLNHLWYLSPYCVALAFFDPEVDDSTKFKMVQSLKRAVPRREKTAPLPSHSHKGEKRHGFVAVCECPHCQVLLHDGDTDRIFGPTPFRMARACRLRGWLRNRGSFARCQRHQ